MTIQLDAAIASHAGTSLRTSAETWENSAPAFGDPGALQRLAVSAAQDIQQQLAVDLVWIGEVTVPRRSGFEDDEPGRGLPGVTVLASTAQMPDLACAVLPDCLAQIAWDVAGGNQTVELSLRNPLRTLVAFPRLLPSGNQLVLIVVARHNCLSCGDIRRLDQLVRGIDLTLTAFPGTAPA
jgi:hypothetical protein